MILRLELVNEDGQVGFKKEGILGIWPHSQSPPIDQYTSNHSSSFQAVQSST